MRKMMLEKSRAENVGFHAMQWTGIFWMTGSTEQMSLTPSDKAEGPCVRGGWYIYSNSSVFLIPSLPSSGVAAANHLPPCHSALCILLSHRSHQPTSCPLSRHPWHRPLGHLPASSTASLRWCIHYLTSAHVQTISLSEYIIFCFLSQPAGLLLAPLLTTLYGREST